MSSHYIIREDQEPALYILDYKVVDEHIIDSLLEWSPRVIISENSVPYIIDKSLKIDAVVVSDIHLNWKGLLNYQWPVEILDRQSCGVSKHLKEKNITNISIIGRFDDLDVCEMGEFETSFESVAVYNGHLKYQMSKNGKFEKWISPGRGILLPMYNTETFWLSDNLKAVDSFRFEVIKEGLVCIRSKTDFWVGESVI